HRRFHVKSALNAPDVHAGRRRVHGRTRDQDHPGAGIDGRLRDGNTHAAGGTVSDVPDRIDRLTRASCGHDDRLAGQWTIGPQYGTETADKALARRQAAVATRT